MVVDRSHAVAREIAARRRAAGLSQDQLASLSGVAQPNIAAYESGARRLSAQMSARLHAAIRPRPSDTLRARRGEVLVLAARHRALDVAVAGSVARGEDEPGSDVDLLVTFAPDASLFDQAALQDELAELLQVPVDVVSRGGLRPGHESMVGESTRLADWK